MSTFKNRNSLRTIEAQIVQKLKDNEARPKFTGSYKKRAYMPQPYSRLNILGTRKRTFPILCQNDVKPYMYATCNCTTLRNAKCDVFGDVFDS